MCFFLALLATSATAATAICTIVLRDDGGADAFDFFVLLLDLLGIRLGIGIQPGLAIFQGILNLLLLFGIKLLTEALVFTRPLYCRPHGMDIAIKRVLCIHALLDLLVFIGKLFCFLDHLFDLLLSETTFIVGDRDLLRFTSSFVLSANIENAIGVNLESDLNLWLSSWCWWDTSKLEFSKQVVVLGHRSFALKDLNVHGWLIVLVSRENLRLLGRNHSVAADELGHNTTDCLDSKRQWRDIKKQQILTSLATQDASLDCCSIGNSLIRIDASVWLLAIEEVLDELLDFRDTC